MDVFVIPVGTDRYELYCEQCDAGPDEPVAPPSSGIFGRLSQRFTQLLKAVEERQHRHDAGAADDQQGWMGRTQDRLLAWVAERIAEQRLLWNLRGRTAAEISYPQEMPFEQVMTLVKRVLKRDYDRHRLWLVVDGLGLLVSAALTLVPGPNLLAYYFVFRVVGHWLSMRGAAQGLHRIEWTGRPCPPLSELRDVAALDPPARDARVHDVARRLRLPHLCSFIDRVAVRA